MARITVVDGNTEFLDLVHDVLESDRHAATTVDGDRPDALGLVRASRPELLVLDLRPTAEGLHGWQLVRELRRDPEFRALPVLLCCGDVIALRELGKDLAGEPNVATLEKPFGIDELTDAVDRLLVGAAAH